MKRIACLLVGIVMMLSIPSVALANSSCSSYNPQSCQNTTVTTTPSTTAAVTQSLPFTGLDVALLLAGGAVLLGAGLVVRRASSRIQ
jgi:hypothetical protein